MTDDDRAADWVEAIKALPRGAAVVVRSRDAFKRESVAKAVLCAARPRGVLTLIAADAKLAIRLRADGVHVPEAIIEKMQGHKRACPRWLTTSSAHGAMGLTKAAHKRADAAILSPIFPTQSHSGAQSLGQVRWAYLRSRVTGSVIALGGVDEKNVRSAVVAGAGGLAIIGAWIGPT
jgi:thiamine-phosphate pyrophosphorylase